MLFYIFNDSLSAHTESDGEKLGVEVHSSVYAYSCPGIADSNDVLNKTTLYNYGKSTRHDLLPEHIPFSRN